MSRTPGSPTLPSTSVDLLVAVGISAGGVVSAQLVFALAGHLSATGAYLATLIPPVVLLLLAALGAWTQGRPLRAFGFLLTEPWPATLTFATLLTLLFLALRLDSGFIFGFGRVLPLAPILFGYFLLSAPVIALGETALFVGYVFRTFAARWPLWISILGSAGFFALYSTDLVSLPHLGLDAALQYLFTTTLEALALGIVLALYLYKSRWGLLGTFTVATALIAATELLPVGALFPSWEVNFAASMVGYAGLLIVVGVGLQEPRIQAQRYLGVRVGPRRHRFRTRKADRAALRSTAVTLAIAGLAFLVVSYGLPAVSGSPRPFLAIATGSMVPTFHRGEFVVIHHVAAADIKVGTIIAFAVSCLPAPTVHRVIRIVSGPPNWVFQTKGDANPSQDPCTVPYSHVLGAVAFYLPYLGFLILDPLFAASVIVLLVLIPLAWRERAS